MVRLSDIIKPDSMRQPEAKKEERSAQQNAGAETVDQEAFSELNAGIQFKEIIKKEETIDQESFDKLGAGVQLKDIMMEKKEEAAVKKVDNKEKIKQYEQIYDNIYEFTKKFIATIKSGKKPDFSECITAIEQIVDTPESLDILYRKAIYAKGLDTTLSHWVNVMVYALKIGIGLGYKRERLIELAMSSLLHDIGMIRIPDSIINKTEKLTDEEFGLLRRHPVFGNELLSKLYPEYPWTAEVAIQEHEREDGKGYPKGLNGNEINDYAKIVSVVDVFEALTHKRPQRKRFLPNDAVKMIVQKEKDAFSKIVIKAMLTKLSAFPLYSYVRLNSKAIGMVIEVDEASPLRPALQMLFDDKGKKIIGEKIVKLKDTPLLYITDSIDEDDLPK
jgi:HD-GYP domain-containing protein (c-di-GMP phosphodiesterase class II)